MSHRDHSAVRLHRGESHKFLEVLIWMVIGLVLYVMIRFVLVDLIEFARLPAPPIETPRVVPAAAAAAVVVVEPASSP